MLVLNLRHSYRSVVVAGQGGRGAHFKFCSPPVAAPGVLTVGGQSACCRVISEEKSRSKSNWGKGENSICDSLRCAPWLWTGRGRGLGLGLHVRERSDGGRAGGGGKEEENLRRERGGMTPRRSEAVEVVLSVQPCLLVLVVRRRVRNF